MSVRKYAAFIKVTEQGSVTAAAAELGISQSGLTQLLNSLEDELGLTLLIRNRSGVKLTEEGAQLLPLMKEVLEADDRVRSLAASLTGTEAEDPGQILKIGSFTSVAVNWLPDIIR
ncbi:MAG: LysR family transcriptional regulator, partial [Lachnospiraceae bacterium]|nr:LysR family transcriptional regulator [Lachnospiraceae bacterium]